MTGRADGMESRRTKTSPRVDSPSPIEHEVERRVPRPINGASRDLPRPHLRPSLLTLLYSTLLYSPSQLLASVRPCALCRVRAPLPVAPSCLPSLSHQSPDPWPSCHLPPSPPHPSLQLPLSPCPPLHAPPQHSATISPVPPCWASGLRPYLLPPAPGGSVSDGTDVAGRLLP
jgi:hypothetical protein